MACDRQAGWFRNETGEKEEEEDWRRHAEKHTGTPSTDDTTSINEALLTVRAVDLRCQANIVRIRTRPPTT